MDTTVTFDAELIQRYDQRGPRYTSYPTAQEFKEGVTPELYAAHARASNALGGPLSLYLHMPFCATACYYCGCSRIPTRDTSKKSPYLARLTREIELQGALFDRARRVEQLHFGGGTPTFFDVQELGVVFDALRRSFTLVGDDEGEFSIEIDPRAVDSGAIAGLRRLGINRVSLGVQDFDPVVQKAVNRLQSEEQTRDVIQAARRAGMRSVSVDLIYGLPFQTKESFRGTLDRVVELRPDRVSVFNYAHLPEVFKLQRRIRREDLPPPPVKLELMQDTIARLVEAGYVFIGMDHFALPDDELAVAMREGKLTRNFQGYSTHADCDMVGLGVTSIGKVGALYAQNHRELEAYYAAIDAGHLAIHRGVEIDAEDQVRGAIITQLMANYVLDVPSIERRFGLRFAERFPRELEALERFRADGLVSVTPTQIEVAPRGKLLIRNVAMVFDRHRRPDEGSRFSKVI